MSVKKKYISKINWKRVIELEETFIKFEHQEISGEIALTKIKKVKEPLYKTYDGIEIKLADNGYYWLQVGIKNAHYWVTAMYNHEMKLIQYYIDITKENKIVEKGKSYFYDLFLDIVQLDNGKIFLLDEDELQDALNNKVINKKEYNLAYCEAKKIIEQIKKGAFEPIKICNEYFNELNRHNIE